MLRFAANLSTMYCEVPFLDRFERAAKSGFKAVEFLFPYDPGVRLVKERIRASDVSVVLFNLHGGDTQAGEWGTMGLPARRDYFRWSFAAALEAAIELGCSRLHAMFGQRVEGLEPQAQIDCALENLLWAAPQAARAGVTLLLEALNPVDFPNYFLRDTLTALEIVRRMGIPNVRLQYDLYHAQMSEGNLIHTLTEYCEWIGHVQIADVPGRNEPGTGEINFPVVFAALENLGYDGYIGLEYRPLRTTSSSLKWMPRSWRGRR